MRTIKRRPSFQVYCFTCRNWVRLKDIEKHDYLVGQQGESIIDCTCLCGSRQKLVVYGREFKPGISKGNYHEK